MDYKTEGKRPQDGPRDIWVSVVEKTSKKAMSAESEEHVIQKNNTKTERYVERFIDGGKSTLKRSSRNHEKKK